MEKMSKEQLLQVHKAIDTARESEIPFVAQSEDGKLNVVGDVNKAQPPKPITHTMMFRFTKDELGEVPQGAVVVGRYVRIDVEYKDVILNPKNDLPLRRIAMDFYPFIESIDEIVQYKEKEIKELNRKYSNQSDENYIKESERIVDEFYKKIVDVYVFASDKTQDAIYKFVAKFLDIDDFMREHMMSTSVLNAFLEIVVSYPDIFNESESFFGY